MKESHVPISELVQTNVAISIDFNLFSVRMHSLCCIVILLALGYMSGVDSVSFSPSRLPMRSRLTKHSQSRILLISGGKAPKESIFSWRYWTRWIGSLLPRKKNHTSSHKLQASYKKSLSSKTRSSSSSAGSIRIKRELKEFQTNPPAYCKVVLEDSSDYRKWTVNITGAKDTLYANETYQLRLIFPKTYPSKPPVVYFLQPCPRHVHVYTNGDICLNILGRDWRPAMTAESVVISIYSMLSSAKEKKIPPDNANHADMSPGLQSDNWMYHDDRC